MSEVINCMHVSQDQIDCQIHRANVFEKMEEMRNTGQFCDVLLVSELDGVQVPAHRLLLSACSEYFAAMFNGSFLESKSDEVKIGEIDGKLLQSLVDFCYSGVFKLSEDSVQRVFIAASVLRLSSLVSNCSAFILNLLNYENCVEYLYFAEQFDGLFLRKQILLYICRHFIELRQTQQLLELDYDKVELLLDSKDLTVDAEQEVFDFIREWLEHEPGRSESYLTKLLNKMRLEMLAPTYISSHVQPLCENSESKQLVIDALLRHLVVPGLELRPYNTRKSRNLLVALVEYESQLQVQIYTPSNNVWTHHVNNYPTRRLFGAGYLQHQLIIVGGEGDTGITNSVKSINVHNYKMSDLSSMRSCRSSLSVTVYKKYLYAVGGYDGTNTLNLVERYSADGNCWRNMAHMLRHRAYLGLVVLRDRLYAVGGCNNHICQNSVECFDSDKNEWHFCAPMNEARAAMGIAATENHIFVFGGYRNLNVFDLSSETYSIERYDPVTNSWTPLGRMFNARVGVSCVYFSHRLLAIGGEVQGEKANYVEEYDGTGKLWTHLAPMKYNQSFGCVVVVPINK